MDQSPLGVVLLNMGGPDELADVPEYLQNIFSDPHILDIPLGGIIRPWLSRLIVKKRAADSTERYRQIGGKTPLNDMTRQQARAIQAALAQRGIPAVVCPVMRYWHPFAGETATYLAEKGVRRMVAMSMYPAYSHATTHSSLEDFNREASRVLPGIPIHNIDHWPCLESYAAFLSKRTLDALTSLGNESIRRSAVLFSAHSLPMKLIARGDPYKSHIEQTYALVAERLPSEIPKALGWQSAVGPAKWLGPNTKEVVKQLCAGGTEHLIVVPLGFAAENIETVWDIDIDLKAFARAQGIKTFMRVPCPNDDKEVMRGLADLIADAAKGT